MNHFKKIAGVLEAHGLDAVLLTCEANRFYASGFHSSGTDGVAIVTRNHNYYFTDSRYTEAAMYGMRRSGKRTGNIPTPPSSMRSSKRNTSPAWGMRMNI
jgi:Xaa-Pro aminopeptidase